MIKAKTVTELWKVEDQINQIIDAAGGNPDIDSITERVEAQVKIAFELGRKEEREVEEEKRLEAGRH